MRRFLIAVIKIMKDILIFAIFTYKLLLLLEFPPISTWHLSNQQVLIINYFFSTANILQILQWQVTFRSLYPFLRPHTYQQEERNRWSSFFLLSKLGLSPYHFPVTSDHSCNDSVGFADKSSAPAHYPPTKRHGENEKSRETWVPPWHLWKGGSFFRFPVGWRIVKTSGWSFDWREERYFAAARTYCRGEISLQIPRMQQVLEVQWQNKKEPWTVSWSICSVWGFFVTDPIFTWMHSPSRRDQSRRWCVQL